MSDTAEGTIPDVLELLTLPSLDGLSELQVRGITCVWCGVHLSAETAVDLGPRRQRLLDTHRNWFPRGCRACTGKKAYEYLFPHAEKCEHCADNPGCPTAVELRRLIREGRR